ncbi:MAG TPA: periplasmic heavy metal sensor [Pyrinomonadaceae bacterium]|jgi:Spy/CpxP family protein refolding chaperone
MRKFNLFNLMLICALSLFVFTTAKAQEEMPVGAPPKAAENLPPRPNLFQELGLTGEQMQQIKRLNSERKPLMQEAQRRVREAMRNLDRAIYADTVNESDVAARLKDLQTAQSEIAKLRSYNELEVRKILTPEQLIKFRELRRRFAERRENFENNRENKSGDPNAPNRRFNRQLRKVPRN